MAVAAVSRTLLRSVRDLSPPPSRTVLPCGPRSSELLAAPLPFLRVCPVRPGGVYRNTGGVNCGARSPPRSAAATAPPRLVSCLSRAGPGSGEFPAPTTRRWGASGIFRERPRFHRTKTSRPMPEGAQSIIFYIFVMESAIRMITIQVELDSRRLGGSALLIPYADNILASTTCRQMLQGVLTDHLHQPDLLATMEKVSMHIIK